MNNQKPFISVFFFFNDTATTEIYTLSLHDALPILPDFIEMREEIITIIRGDELEGGNIHV